MGQLLQPQQPQLQPEPPAVSVHQKGESNTCSVGNTINIHVQHFNACQSLNGYQYYYDNTIDYGILKSLIPTFEKLSEFRFQIKIKSYRGIIDFDVHPKDTIQSVKLKLQLLYGIPHNKQKLVFGENVLEDEDTLEDRRVENESLLRMVYSLDEKETVLICQHVLGRTFCLGVERETTIKEVKMKIEETEEIPADRQRLFLADGRTLKNESKIADCNIGQNVVKVALTLLKEDMINIVVKTLTSRYINILIGKYETVEDLKLKIEVKEGIPPDQQRFIFGGQQLEDNFTLSHYFIGEKASLHLVLRLSGGDSTAVIIQIRTSIGEVFSIGFCPLSTTIGKVKRIVEETRGFLVRDQKLYLNDGELSDENRELRDYGVSGAEDIWIAKTYVFDLILISKAPSSKSSHEDESLNLFYK